MNTWSPGDRVIVSLPYGTDGVTLLPGHVSQVREIGPYKPHRTVKVVFDDPLVYGGFGTAWVSPTALAYEGEPPAEPERSTE